MNLFVGFILLGFTMANGHRSKRLIFPPTSPTRVQIITGIGVPIELNFESVIIGWVLKAEYYLPDNTTLIDHSLNDPFNPITLPITSRRRRDVLIASQSEQHNIHDHTEVETNKMTYGDHYEKYDVEATEIDRGSNAGNHTDDDDSEYYDDDDEEYTRSNHSTRENDFGTARWTFFKAMEILLERQGYEGHACMLRSICESAHAPFTFSSGILGELLHIFMTPSSTADTINDHSQNEYLRAEQLGRAEAPCDKVFKECTASVLDQISGIYSSVENIMKMFG